MTRSPGRRLRYPRRLDPILVNNRLVHEVQTALVEQRLFEDLTQDEVAARAGLTRAQLAHIESGRQPPSLEQLYALARAYNVDPKGLLP
jgi:transcriptional regulator with XRE-family HTH domain